MHHFRLLTGFAALALAGTAAGCSNQPEAPAATDGGLSDPAAPDAPQGISVRDGWLSLPAVAGNPGAVYFAVRNAGENDVVISAVDVAATGSAMMHETTITDGRAQMQHLMQLAVPRDDEVVFEPGGKHVMVMELDETLAAGGSADVTLIFSNGDKISFPAAIRAAGDEG